jgi:hypothetical protein
LALMQRLMTLVFIAFRQKIYICVGYIIFFNLSLSLFHLDINQLRSSFFDGLIIRSIQKLA